MIAPSEFLANLQQQHIDMFFGVPDSLLASFCAYVDHTLPKNQHRITANEGNALAMAAGYHLATGKTAAVYLQNSGLGNLVNPLTSLTDAEVYKIPALLIIGWRGEPGVKDEPQHVKQGRITPALLDLLEIPYIQLQAGMDIQQKVVEACQLLEKHRTPVAFLVQKGAFSDFKAAPLPTPAFTMSREQALDVLLGSSTNDDIFISTTGKTSRELFELRKKRGQVQQDFLTVGAMGHTSSIALGVAIAQPERTVFCLDGDGSMLMHMGSLAIIGSVAPKHFIHVVLNNQSHESVGGQPTVAGEINLRLIAQALNYQAYFCASTPEEVSSYLQEIRSLNGPVLFEIKIAQGSRADLGRPDSTAEQNKLAFMDHLHG